MRKRAVSGIMIAGSMVMMCAAADAADTVSAEAVTAAVDMRTDLATGGTAGVVVSLNRVSAEAAASVEQTQTTLVAAAEETTPETENTTENVTVDMSAEGAADTAEGTTAEVPAGTTEDVTADTTAGTTEDVTADTTAGTTEDAAADATAGTTEDVTTETTEAAAEEKTQQTDETLTQEEAEWQNRLMADVDEFLYVRASGDADAEIVGKLYKGDVAEVVEDGDTWTHVVSGNVEGYVNNDYCVSGTEALNYAQQNVELQAEIQTDGLRVRSEAAEDAPVITAVSTGTVLTVDTDAQVSEDWVAVEYNGQTAYVSAEYVTTDYALGEAISIEEERAAQEKQAQEEAAQTTQTTTVQNEAVSASVDDVTLLAALIQCEAGNESYEGQLAVGAVVMNRVRSGAYPGSIYDVIYQRGQFPPAGKGMVAQIAANGPKASCVQAAQEALSGADNTGGATCFSRASSGRAGVVIGNHVFY